jgi:hypothetical protein
MTRFRFMYSGTTWLGAAAFGLLVHAGCGSHEFNTSASPTGMGGNGGSSSTTTSGTKITTTTSSTAMGSVGGMGGGGGGTQAHGPAATGTVTEGNRASSTKFVAVQTMGQSTINQSRSSSNKYVLQGGLVGANGS